MLVRIVKMNFDPQKTEEFLSIFEQNKEAIRGFKGCLYLELNKDKNSEEVYFTYSHWTDEAALNAYRESELFEEVWSKTKALFNDKPQAWSVDRLTQLS